MDTSPISTNYAALPNAGRMTETAPARDVTPGSGLTALPASSVTAAPKTDSPANEAAISHAVTDLNQVLKTVAVNLNFMVDQDSGKTIVKLVDTESNTVLRQYPTEQALAIARQIEHFQEGLLIKTQA